LDGYFRQAEFSDAKDLKRLEKLCMLMARLGAERPVDFSLRILEEVKHSARSECMVCAFCRPLLLLA
jgi:hypothetical protein